MHSTISDGVNGITFWQGKLWQLQFCAHDYFNPQLSYPLRTCASSFMSKIKGIKYCASTYCVHTKIFQIANLLMILLSDHTINVVTVVFEYW